MNNPAGIKEVALLFLKLGLIGFGGPAVHIALMQKEVVEKRKWMDENHFLDLVGATNLIPGPNSTEMAMHCGHERAGWKGLIVAGFCFIMPAVLLTAILAWAYQRYGQLPDVKPFIYGIQPAILSVVVVSMIALARKALKSVTIGIIGLLSAIAVLAGMNEIYVLFGAGLTGILIYLFKENNRVANCAFPCILLQASSFNLDSSSLKLFWIFLKIGAILYGSGYVLFAFLDAELVARGLITKQQLVDAIAVGQITPGPVFSSATFVGWQIGGLSGATQATIGIFLPSFLFVGLLNPLMPKLRRSKIMAAFLDTVNITSIGIILSVIIEMSRYAIADWRTAFLAVLSFIVTWYFKNLNTAYIIIGGGLAGYALFYI